MTRLLCIGTLASSVLLAAVSGARAQQGPPSPHIGYVFPAGGRQGATFEVTVGGQALVGTRLACFSGQGVRATVGAYDRPLNGRELQVIRNKLEETRKKLQGDGQGLLRPRPGPGGPLRIAQIAREAGVTDVELRKLVEFQQSRTDPKKAIFPQIAEKVTLQVSIEANAAPGPRELRLLSPLGLSNPIRFEVGQLPEHRESEPNGETPDGVALDGVGVVINGQIMPGDVDRFAFSARKGTHLVAAVEARGLMPYLADAVPGWFQSTLALIDPEGKELAYADHFRFHQDPVIAVDIPQDGEYVLQIGDSLYRGRDDFVYRITVGEVPLVTGIFPLGGAADSPTKVQLAGWNLPMHELTISDRGAGPGVVGVSARRGGLTSNSVPFAVSSLPERAEKEPDDQPARAQRVTLPVIVNGRIDRPGDVDVYTFGGRAGSQVVAEVAARRLGSPLDSTLTLTGVQKGVARQLAFSDDFEDRGAGLITHQADSRLALTLPATGVYYLAVRDAQRRGGPEYAYRLRISAPRPDFELRVVPSSIGARGVATVPITVYALRRDGFGGGIALEMKDSPGFGLSGGLIPAGQDAVRMTITMPRAGGGEPVRLQMVGRATIAGQEVLRAAVPADDMMQAFAYHHLVPAQEWVAVVGARGFGPGVWRRDTGPVRIPAGGAARVRFVAPNTNAVGQLALALSEPPDGIAVQKVEPEAGGVAVVIRADAKVKPGLKGNLIVVASRERPQLANARPGAGRQRLPVGTLPAIPFEILPP